MVIYQLLICCPIKTFIKHLTLIETLDVNEKTINNDLNNVNLPIGNIFLSLEKL